MFSSILSLVLSLLGFVLAFIELLYPETADKIERTIDDYAWYFEFTLRNLRFEPQKKGFGLQL